LHVCILTLLCMPKAASGALPHSNNAYGEIADLVRKHALLPPHNIDIERFARGEASGEGNNDAVRDFLRSFDRYAGYHTAGQYKNLLAVQDAFPAGVGMDLLLDANGNIICVPFPASPAADAGIRYGDILLGVDALTVSGSDLEDVAVLIRGNPGTSVTLRLLDKDRVERSARLVRKKLVPATTALSNPVQDIPCIRIYRFGPTTLKELNSLLAKISAGKRPDKLILDLRGNTGGDMQAGLEVAKLFLRAGARLPDIRSRTAIKKQTAEQNGKFAETQVIFWQDGLTASAAELLIAAVAVEGKAMNIGCTSAGKATIQQIFKLADGSMLKLTTEEMLFPESDAGWGQTGIEPKIPVSGTVLDEDAWFEDLTVMEYRRPQIH
jgi:carboxyl-terminal processing protease